jgi:mannose-6-phosphate isomerase-like protein (cupin superfamily)
MKSGLAADVPLLKTRNPGLTRTIAERKARMHMMQNSRIVPAALRTMAIVGLCVALGASHNKVPVSFQLLGNTMTFAVTAAQTHGASVTIDEEVPPGGGPPAHVHTREDETYVVTRGHFRFWRGTRAIDAWPGSIIYLPRNVPHQFLNVGNAPGELVLTIVPAGIERMFLAISQRGLSVPQDRAEIIRLGREYGITYVAPLASRTATK